MNVTHVACGPAVNESERKAFARLKERLSREPGDGRWMLLTNLAFSASHQGQPDEIDVVAIGPPGIRVVEVKHWAAAWVRRNSGLVEDEADRVIAKARKIAATMRRKIGSLPHVNGVFLTTEAPGKVGALEGRTPVRGVSFHTLKTCLDAVGFHEPNALSSRQVEMLCRSLYPGSAVAIDGSLTRLAGYARLALRTPRNDRFHRVYKATHTRRQEQVILHLYDLSANAGGRADDKAENEAEREWRSLQRLQQYVWAPRIVDSYQDAPGYPGELKFFTIADPAAPSLEERAADDAWDTDARLAFARKAVLALNEFHEANKDGEPMVHRNLTPNTILVKHDNTPVLTDFELTRIPSEVSVAGPAAGKEWGAQVAPEIRTQGLGAADPRSDVYSLCASLSGLFENREDETGAGVAEILALGTDDNPEKRSNLSDLDDLLSDRLGEPAPEPPPPSTRFWTEEQVVDFRGDNYRIDARLGSGGVGTAFKVVKLDRETGGDLGVYVAKVARDEQTGKRIRRAFELARPHLRHAALSTVFEVAPEWRDDGFLALMSWIEGEPLGEHACLLPILAEDLHRESGEALALEWLRTACEALRVLHDNGLIHGDVSPRNMVVSGVELVLTDYDCVTKIGERIAAPGAVSWCSPSCLQGRDAAPSDDLYALGASFFQLLFDREPFRHGGDLAKDRGLNWDGLDRSEYPLVSEFMDRATDPDPEKRPATAAAALAMLARPEHAGSPAEAPEQQAPGDAINRAEPALPIEPAGERVERRQNEVEWLRWLLQSYPGSRFGNTETRGLDTGFATDTYVETDLEQALYRDIAERRASLVVLCGNAGDGKTALLQRLAKRLGLDARTSATRILQGLADDGLTVRMNLDGSASWKGRSADDLLDEFLKPFRDGPPDADIAHFLAINDGRLLEWIENVGERDGETPLTKNLYEFLEDEDAPSGSHIRFVNLNRRSLVGGVAPDGATVETGFPDRLMDALYGGDRAAEIWSPCRTCSAQERCEVFRAARLFGPDGLADKAARDHARQRFFELLQAVYLRGETHITVRELRATMVYILFGIHYCSDYHAVSDGSVPALQPYWNRVFSPESPGRQGEVLRELPRFDPALEAHPQIDRRLLHPPSSEADAGSPGPDGVDLKSARRRAWFEWTQAEIARATHDLDALGLAGGSHLRRFRDIAIADDDKKATLVVELCGGISRLESLPPLAFGRSGAVPLRVSPRTPTETALWIEKPVNGFRLEADIPDGEKYLGRLHRQAFLIYRYRDGREERLRLGADLFHLLLELNDGYQLGDVASDDTFAHLSIFVRRLVQEDYRRMFAWNPMREDTVFRIEAKIDDAGAEPRQRLSIASVERGGTDGE